MTGRTRSARGPATWTTSVVLLFLLLAAVMAIPALARQGEATARDLTKPATFTDTAPAVFQARFETTIGIIIVRVQREWAPHGADRFYNLVKHGFYDNCRFFRVIKGFAAQFGIHGTPTVAEAWVEARIQPDRPRLSNTRGRVTFAMQGLVTTRTTQVFINFGNNSRLDIDGFAPFGEVTSSMLLAERLFSDYGEGPDQAYIQAGGNAFLAQFFPRLDYIKSAKIETGETGGQVLNSNIRETQVSK